MEGVDRSHFGESDLGDSCCSDKMGQMERIPSVQTCFTAADDVKAAG